MTTIRLTALQAMNRWLPAQLAEDGTPFISVCCAIFGHGNVAGIGGALKGIGDALPTWCGQNEQTMAHAAIAYAKTRKRRRAMAVVQERLARSLSILLPSRSTTSKRQPSASMCSPTVGNRSNAARTYPAVV